MLIFQSRERANSSCDVVPRCTSIEGCAGLLKASTSQQDEGYCWICLIDHLSGFGAVKVKALRSKTSNECHQRNARLLLYLDSLILPRLYHSSISDNTLDCRLCLSMKDYIRNLLLKFDHPLPSKPQHSPHRCRPINYDYGAKVHK